MYLKRIIIKNFRVFDENGITLMFNKGINAIIGENNSGKSAVIDAIRIAYSTTMYKKDIFFMKSDLHIQDDGKVVDYAQFDIYLDEVPKRLVEIWDPISENSSGGEFHIKFEKYSASNGEERIRAKYWGIGTEGNKLSLDTFDAIDLVFLGALRDSESEMKPSRNSKLAQLLKNLVPKEETRNELVDILSEANEKLLQKDQLKKTRSTINDNLTNIEQEFLSQQVDIGLIEPRFDSIASSLRAWIKPKWVLISVADQLYGSACKYANLNKECNKIQVLDEGIYFDVSILEASEKIDEDLQKRIEFISNSTFELHQNGLGYNNLLFMSAVLGDMAIVKEGVYQNLLLIEEPEAHLHPQLQELVHNFLSNANQNDSNIQVIYTSHSPTLASKIDISNINLIYEANHKKYCLPFSETKLTDTDKGYLQKYLDVTKSQMFFAKGIIFVEGISEAILLPEVAKSLDKPLEKYAVELVNVDSVAFKPFINLFSSENVKACFSKVAVITDDDRCTAKKENDYIDKNLDYDDIDNEIAKKLVEGKASNRYQELENQCNAVGINIFSANKTLEYALCCDDNNIAFMVDAIKKEYVEIGIQLEQKINDLSTMEEKAACIWLFIRTRDRCKGAVAQYISQVIREQHTKKLNKEYVEKEFIIPGYLKEAIYCVTEEKTHDS